MRSNNDVKFARELYRRRDKAETELQVALERCFGSLGVEKAFPSEEEIKVLKSAYLNRELVYLTSENEWREYVEKNNLTAFE